MVLIKKKNPVKYLPFVFLSLSLSFFSFLFIFFPFLLLSLELVHLTFSAQQRVTYVFLLTHFFLFPFYETKTKSNKKNSKKKTKKNFTKKMIKKKTFFFVNTYKKISVISLFCVRHFFLYFSIFFSEPTNYLERTSIRF